MITCRKDSSIDKRDKYIGVYIGNVYLSNGCIKVDTIPEFDTILNVSMSVVKYGTFGISCRSSFYNFDFDSINYYSDSSIYLRNIIGGRCVIFSGLELKFDSMYFFYRDETKFCNGTNCPRKAKEKVFNAIKII